MRSIDLRSDPLVLKLHFEPEDVVLPNFRSFVSSFVRMFVSSFVRSFVRLRANFESKTISKMAAAVVLIHVKKFKGNILALFTQSSVVLYWYHILSIQ
jgi:hypothetical protein